MRRRIRDLGEHWFALSVITTITLTAMLFELADKLD
jgi:hypothetical protein